jgi:hypothetical protein
LDMPFGKIAANWAIRAPKEGISAALESVWKAKREYRAELAKKRTSRFSEFRASWVISGSSRKGKNSAGLHAETCG